MLHNECSALESEWRALQREVEDSYQIWRDETRRTFEAQCWSELEQTVPAYLDALNSLAETIDYVRQQLEAIR